MVATIKRDIEYIDGNPYYYIGMRSVCNNVLIGWG